MIKEIRKDIHRGQIGSLVGGEVEDILVQVCSSYEEVGYCQGMHYVVEFLIKVMR